VTPVRFMSHATVLLVHDVQIAGDYYEHKLGFEVTYYDLHPDHYAYASREHVHFHFAHFEGAPPRPNVLDVPPDMFDVYIYVNDVEQLYEEFTERGAEIVQKPHDQAWNHREIRVRDPHGYILAFGQLIK